MTLFWWLKRWATEILSRDLLADLKLVFFQVLNLLEPLVSLSTGKVPDPSHADESTGNQQLALLTLRSFTRALGSHHPLEFKTACEKLSKKSHLKELDNPTVMAATLLCLTDMFAAIGPHAVVSLQPFAQFLVDLMSRGHLAGSNPVLLSSIVYTVKTCMENFGGFLNPFYSKLVVSACKLSCIDQNEDNSQQKKSRERYVSPYTHLNCLHAKNILQSISTMGTTGQDFHYISTARFCVKSCAKVYIRTYFT